MVVPEFGDILTGFGLVETFINRLFERKDLVGDNAFQLIRIRRDCQDAIRILNQVEHYGQIDPISNTRLSGFRQNLDEVKKSLEDWSTDIEKAHAWNRVRRMKAILDQCEQQVKKVLDFLSDSIAPQMRNASEEIPADDYREGMNNVPPNPPRLTFDFSSQCSPEGQLKSVVLSEDSKGAIAVIASGLGGAGKTCALRELHREEEVVKRFPGGVLYLQLGNESNQLNIIQELCKVVRRTGGVRLAQRLQQMKSLGEVTDSVALWFAPYACLFLIDDVWLVNDIDSYVLSSLETILNDGSRLVYTTRDQRLGEHCETVIDFKEREALGAVARRMLMNHAGFQVDQKLSNNNERAVTELLKLCDGLPLALGIAGATVRAYAKQRVKNIQNAWQDFLDNASTIRNRSAERYGKLELIVDSSLHVLQSEDCEAKFGEKFSKLCVARKKQDLPLSMLQCLWGVEDLKQTMQYTSKFNDVSIVRIRREDANYEYVQIHDRVLDVAVDRASDEYKAKCFKTLLHNYKERARERGLQLVDERNSCDMPKSEARSEAGKKRTVKRMMRQLRIGSHRKGDDESGVEGEAECTMEVKEGSYWAWWKFEDDGYIVNNLCRVLYEAGCLEELLWLLSQPGWIVMRLQHNGIYHVDEDIEWGKLALRHTGSDNSSHMRHLETVFSAARMSKTFVLLNKREAWFRIHGHLLQYGQSCERTRHFIEEIERCAPRPWVKASLGFLQPANGVFEDLIPVGKSVLCVAEFGHLVCVVSQDVRADNRIKWTVHDRETELQEGRTLYIEGELIGIANRGGISSDMRRIAVGGANGKVYVWNTDTCTILRTFDQPYGSISGVGGDQR